MNFWEDSDPQMGVIATQELNYICSNQRVAFMIEFVADYSWEINT